MLNRLFATIVLVFGIVFIGSGGQLPGLDTAAQPALVSAEQNLTVSTTLTQPSAAERSTTNRQAPSDSPDASPVALITTIDRTPPATNSTPPTLDELRGKIIFFSDRGTPYPELYRMNPDGSDQRLCNCASLFEGIFLRETAASGGSQFLYNKNGATTADDGLDTQIWLHDSAANKDRVVAGAAPGFPRVDYDAVFSPDGTQVAWVTEAHTFAEIYRYDFATDESTLLTESHGEWNKHPSFSPDGTRIVFWRNAPNADVREIWVMNADGTHQVKLSGNGARDWDPIWVK